MDEHDDEPIYFAHSASLRIFGDVPDLPSITSSLNLSPTHVHRVGDKRSPRATPYEHDMWSFSPDVPKDAALDEHIDALWAAIKPHREYLIKLKQTVTVDVFLAYRSNCDHAGIDIRHESLEMFTYLEIPLRLSIIVV